MTEVNRRRLLVGTAFGGAALAAPSVAQAQETVEWRMQALWDAGTTPYEFEKKFVARVAERAAGGDDCARSHWTESMQMLNRVIRAAVDLFDPWLPDGCLPVIFAPHCPSLQHQCTVLKGLYCPVLMMTQPKPSSFICWKCSCAPDVSRHCTQASNRQL